MLAAVANERCASFVVSLGRYRCELAFAAVVTVNDLPHLVGPIISPDNNHGLASLELLLVMSGLLLCETQGHERSEKSACGRARGATEHNAAQQAARQNCADARNKYRGQRARHGTEYGAGDGPGLCSLGSTRFIMLGRVCGFSYIPRCRGKDAVSLTC